MSNDLVRATGVMYRRSNGISLGSAVALGFGLFLFIMLIAVLAELSSGWAAVVALLVGVALVVGAVFAVVAMARASSTTT